MKKNLQKIYYGKNFKRCITLGLLLWVYGITNAQSSHVGAGSVLYFNGNILTDQVITTGANSSVYMTAGTTFTGNGYVDGQVNVKTNGVTTVPIGSGASKSTINITTTGVNEDIATNYLPTAASGTMDAALLTYALSDAEYWIVSQTTGTDSDVAVSGLTNTATTYDGDAPLGSPILVRRTDATSNWVAYSTNPGFGEFTYAAETVTLSTGEYDLQNLSFYPNPVATNVTSINFNLPNSVQQLSITMYDITGKIVQRYINVPVQAGTNSINKPQIAKGLYLLEFSFNNNAQKITKKIIIE